MNNDKVFHKVLIILGVTDVVEMDHYFNSVLKH